MESNDDFSTNKYSFKCVTVTTVITIQIDVISSIVFMQVVFLFYLILIIKIGENKYIIITYSL
jgi:hypothetical protein